MYSDCDIWGKGLAFTPCAKSTSVMKREAKQLGEEADLDNGTCNSGTRLVRQETDSVPFFQRPTRQVAFHPVTTKQLTKRSYRKQYNKQPFKRLTSFVLPVYDYIIPLLLGNEIFAFICFLLSSCVNLVLTLNSFKHTSTP